MNNNTVISEEVLMRAILQKSVRKTSDETRVKKTNQVVADNYRTQRNVLNLPGNTSTPDMWYFNPFEPPSVRFTQNKELNVESAFPATTYYNNVMTNDANNPVVFEVNPMVDNFKQLAPSVKQQPLNMGVDLERVEFID